MFELMPKLGTGKDGQHRHDNFCLFIRDVISGALRCHESQRQFHMLYLVAISVCMSAILGAKLASLVVCGPAWVSLFGMALSFGSLSSFR